MPRRRLTRKSQVFEPTSNARSQPH